jgi:hypothetical protein
MINYSKIQTTAKTALLNSGAFPVIVRLSTTNTAISTFAVFMNGTAKNVDNRQNPTWMTGEVGRVAIVPGIDFVGAVTPNVTTTPQVAGTVEWIINCVQFKKTIVTVGKEEPIPNMPILYALGIA